jgi:uncharacterized protein involved in oxidation of intracellular sulfur
MKIAIILNDPPYGDQRCVNGLQLALALREGSGDNEVSLFLMVDAVHCAEAHQVTTDNGVNLEQIMRKFLSLGGDVLACTSCMDARGLTGDEFVYGAWLGSIEELAALTSSSGRILVI